MPTLNITLILMIDNHVTEVSLFAFPLHPTEAACILIARYYLRSDVVDSKSARFCWSRIFIC